MYDRLTIKCLSLTSFGLMMVVISACGREAGTSTPAPGSSFVLGMQMGSDGNLRATSGEAYRDEYQQRIMRALNNSLQAGWRAQVRIAETPTYTPPAHQGFEGTQSDTLYPTVRAPHPDGWSWQQAQVTVTLIGEHDSPDPNLSPQTVEDFIRRVMREKMDPQAALAIEVAAGRMTRVAQEARSTEEVSGFPPAQAAALEELDFPETAPVIPRQARYSGPTTAYTVQEGDTWAQISIAFYGTPSYWRVILSANPDMTTGDLVPGREIRVPDNPR